MHKNREKRIKSKSYEMKSFGMRAAIVLMAALCFLATGCSSIITARKQKKEIMVAYDVGNYAEAAELIDEKAEDRKDSGDAVMWFLDCGTINFDLGKYKKSLACFRSAEKQINEYRDRATVSARDSGAEVGSAITNPNAIAYRGMCRDRVLLNVYKALDYFGLGNTEGAMVELRRARFAQKVAADEFRQEIDKAQKEVDEQNAKNRQQAANSAITYNKLAAGSPELRKINQETSKHANKTYRNFLNPFVSYMSAIGYLIENNDAEACVDFRRLNQMFANNKLVRRDYVTCSKAAGEGVPGELSDVKPWPYQLNRDVVFVIYADGRGAAYKEFKIQLPLPYVGYTGIAFPVVEYFPDPPSPLNILSSNGKQLAKTTEICDMDAVVASEYKERLPTMITRLAISYLTKEIASQVALIAARQGGGTGGLIAAYVGTGIYKYLFNTADTRCWETIPKRYCIAHFKLPSDRKATLATSGGTIKLKGKSKEAPVIKKAASSLELSFPAPDNFFIVYVRRARNGEITARILPVK